MTLAALTLTALLGAAPAAPATPAIPDWKPVVRPATPSDVVELPPTTEPRDFSKPPPGKPEDRRLWSELRDGTGQATIALARIVELAHRIKYGEYLPLLDAKRAADASGAGTALRVRLERALDAAATAVPREPGVYRCRHVLLDLEQRMPEPPTSEMGRELPEARRDARACADRLSRLIAAVEPAAQEIDASLAAIDGYLGRAQPVAPASAGKAEAAATERASQTLAGVER